MNRLAAARVGAYAAVVIAGTWGLWSVRDQQDRLDRVVRDQQVAAVVDQANRCVTSWETREDIRDAIEKGARAPASAITRLVVELGRDTSALDRLNVLVGEEITAARGEISDPTCDRDAAQHLLDDPAAAQAAVDG